MLITGIQSVYEPRGELVVLNCEVLEHLGAFRRISEDFTGFPHASENLIVPCERARRKVLYADTRFRQVAGFPVRW